MGRAKGGGNLEETIAAKQMKRAGGLVQQQGWRQGDTLKNYFRRRIYRKAMGWARATREEKVEDNPHIS